MEFTLTVNVTDAKTVISSKNSPTVTIVDTPVFPTAQSTPALIFLLKKRQFLAIGKTSDLTENLSIDFDQIITVSFSWEDELDYLEQVIFDEAKDAHTLMKKLSPEINIPKNAQVTASNTKDWLLSVFSTFGYTFENLSLIENKKTGKTRHKWSKEVSQIEFFVDTRQSKATVLWQKRNEMLIKKGAVMMPEPPLNKDGSLGFSAKMGQKIRADNASVFEKFITTEDLVLKSVNEVGLFLYFAGTNSWLELKDASGRTIEDWTKIE
ncbi:hypothetical protein RV11_GL000017 [Enterococcus phoeniculicola]|jgi:hypothetical protein|uniref:Uncharacterized protein n=1 Tax=Enterococcus phoeniculicola ATCC BAA-412 TaxID=1158610 RepID=R3TWP0_9ENTE|nr:hypothetical protein [Enterococcus phoeniculicola]EOL45543.1 hypothetical protein UC3_01433 [Enterococcus phoeniculicola ATCC BAA-412]EOT74905.1 hypothetical protein I589_02505 [Enterococcus phoeniculicola ATCC BAA-412]OJG73651.1 hypothetical protein RV11_GL000017 [Enterococcus phoeniculicola]